LRWAPLKCATSQYLGKLLPSRTQFRVFKHFAKFYYLPKRIHRSLILKLDVHKLRQVLAVGDGDLHRLALGKMPVERDIVRDWLRMLARDAAGAPLQPVRRPGRHSVLSMEKKHAFTPAERWAVFTTHGTAQGTKCWLCSEPLYFRAMEVDHVLPERLLDDQAALAETLTTFGLPPNFDLNSFEDWLPAHRHCNLQKLNHVFRPTPLIQRWLDRARAKAGDARQLCNVSANERRIERAIGILAAGDKALPPELLDSIVQNYAVANSAPVIVGDQRGYVPPNEVRLGPNLMIIFDRDPRPDANGPFTYKIDASGIGVDSPVLDAPVMKGH
jgi:hypothetical protein